MTFELDIPHDGSSIYSVSQKTIPLTFGDFWYCVQSLEWNFKQLVWELSESSLKVKVIGCCCCSQPRDEEVSLSRSMRPRVKAFQCSLQHAVPVTEPRQNRYSWLQNSRMASNRIRSRNAAHHCCTSTGRRRRVLWLLSSNECADL